MIPLFLEPFLACTYGKKVSVHAIRVVSFSEESVVLEIEIQLPGEDKSKVPVKITK